MQGSWRLFLLLQGRGWPKPAPTTRHQVRRRSSAATPVPTSFTQLIKPVEAACLPAQQLASVRGRLQQASPAAAAAAAAATGSPAGALLAMCTTGCCRRYGVRRLCVAAGGMRAPSGHPQTTRRENPAAAGHQHMRWWPAGGHIFPLLCTHSPALRDTT